MKRDNRRHGIARTLSNLGMDIIGLQETGFPMDANCNLKWQATFSCPSIFSCHCALLIRNPLISILSSNILLDGRVLMVHLKFFSLLFQVAVVYAPPSTGPKKRFFLELSDIQWPPSTIFLGDFNCYLDPTVDHFPGSRTSKPGRLEFSQFIISAGISNILNPTSCTLSNMSRVVYKPLSGGGISGSRIDHIFAPSDISFQFSPIQNFPMEFSDHRLIISKWLHRLEIPRPQHRIRPLFATNPILSADIFEHVYPLVAHPRVEQALSIPDIWGKVKAKISSRASLKAKERAAAFMCAYKKALSRLKHLEANTPAVMNPRWATQMVEAKCKFDRLQRSKTKKANLAAISKHLNESETMSPYFLRSIAPKNSFKTIMSLEDPDGTLVETPDAISEVISNFYSQLYSSDQVSLEDGIKILREGGFQLQDPDLWKGITNPITIDEVTTVVSKFPRRKASGPDGIPHELYYANSPLFIPVLTELFNHCLQHSIPIPGGGESNIVLLFKKGPDTDIRNWRPISLANTDYKILTKILANRLAPLCPKVIHPNQSGFTIGRSIWDNVLQVNNMLMSRFKFTCGYALFLDMEKAYDRVNWEFLFSTLRHYGLPVGFIDWLRLLYSNLSSKVILQSSFSKEFPICQGLRQGDPLSPTLFNFVIDTFLRILTNNLDGIRLHGRARIKSLAFADDTVVMIGNNSDYSKFVKCVDLYQSASNALLNTKKTITVTVGQPNFSIPFPTLLGDTTFRHLGIMFKSSGIDSSANEQALMAKIQGLITIWRSKQISLFGRCIGANVFVLSKIWFTAHVVPFTPGFMYQIKKFLQQWLWPSYKIAPTSINKVISNRSSGGMGLIDPQHQCDKLLSKFILPVISPDLAEPDCVWNTQASVNWTRGLGKSPNSKPALQSWLMNKQSRGPHILDPYWKMCARSFKRTKIVISEVHPILPTRGFQNRTFTLTLNKKHITSVPKFSPDNPVRMPLNPLSYPQFPSNEPVWRKIWHLSQSKVMPAFQRTTMWRTLTRSWRTAERCSRDFSGNICPLCEDPYADTHHRYFTCKSITPIWDIIYRWLTPNLSPRPSPNEDIFFLQSLPDIPESIRSIVFHTILYLVHRIYLDKVASNLSIPESIYPTLIFPALQSHISRVWKSNEARVSNRSSIQQWKSKASTWLKFDSENSSEVLLILPNNLSVDRL